MLSQPQEKLKPTYNHLNLKEDNKIKFKKMIEAVFDCGGHLEKCRSEKTL